jgi:hypothetical protein
MRLFQAKIPVIAQEAVKALRGAGAIETEAPREVETDIAAVLSNYLRIDAEAGERAKDYMEQRGLGQTEFARLRRSAAEQAGIKTGDETLDFLLDQVVEMLFHSQHVEEVFAEDHELRRQMAPIFKKHMAVDDELEREVRGRLKHMQEGTSTWEVEYQRVMTEIRRRKGLGLAPMAPHDQRAVSAAREWGRRSP